MEHIVTHALESNNLAWEFITTATNSAQITDGDQSMNMGGKLPPWAVLAVFLLLGAILIFVPHFWEWRWDYEITSEVGVALLFAAILGFTIHRWMAAELSTDAFLASVGHVLPQEFRAEVSRIIGYRLICEKHLLLINIDNVGNGLVRVTSAIERTIRNRSSNDQRINNMAHIDEWGNKTAGPSQIVDCILEIDDAKIVAGAPKLDAYSVQQATIKRKLKPNQVAKLQSKWVEYKPVNDDLHYSFATPTVNPVIEVHVSDDLDCIFNFGMKGVLF
jgi:hypothetical protein